MASAEPLRTEVEGLREALADLERARAAEPVGSSAHDELATAVIEHRAELRDAVEGWLSAVTSDELEQLDGKRPIALLPVRMETHFTRDDSGNEVLRVRLYPDQVHVDVFEPLVTETEWEAGLRWLTDNDSDDEPTRRRAWGRLTGRFGAARAAWIAKLVREAVAAAGGGDPVTPAFRADGATPPVARLLPDRWILVAQPAVRGSTLETFVGSAIPDGLPVAPSFEDTEDLLEEVWDEADGAPAPDGRRVAGIRWMLDFQEALRVGMALEIPLTGDRARGFDFLLAYGVRASADARAAGGALEALLGAHVHASGFAFLAQETPTNNVDGDRSGFAARDRMGSRSFERVDAGGEDAASGAGRWTNAAVTTRALGLTTETASAALAESEGGDLVEQTDAWAMATACWRPTWGYFFEQLLSPVVTPDLLRRLRRHFIAHVRGRGPLPVIRAGDQPYGLLPVTSVDRWSALEPAVDDSPTALVEALRAIRNVWRDSVSAAAGPDPHVPRSGDRPDDFHQTLIELLGLGAVSTSYATRTLLGRSVLLNLGARLVDPTGSDPNPAATFIEDLRGKADAARQVLVDLGLADSLDEFWGGDAPDPRLARGLFSPESEPFDAPLVHAGPVDEGPLEPDYINELLLAPELSYAELRNEEYSDTLLADQADAAERLALHPPLLFIMLRRAILLEYQVMARRALVAARDELVADGDILEPEFPGVDGALGVSPERIIERFIEVFLDGDQPQLRRDAFDPSVLEARGLSPEEIGESTELWSSLEWLGELSSGQLALLLPETLDLAGHRYDAWETSIATRRLWRLRESSPPGIHVGAYGWIDDVRPAGDESGYGASSEGYLYAPSLDQATTGAVLYDGFLSRGGGRRDETDDGEGSGDDATGADDEAEPLSIDLSSNRVRAALRLLEAVRSGHALGAVLGYELERGLREADPAELLRKVEDERAVEGSPEPPLGLEQLAVVDRTELNQTLRLVVAGLVLVLRRRFPLVGGKREAAQGQPEDDVESAGWIVGPTDVVDGLALVRALRESGDEPTKVTEAIAAITADRDETAEEPGAIAPGLMASFGESLGVEADVVRGFLAAAAAAAVDQLVTDAEDRLDAVADLLTAEGVHQLLLGNTDRATAALDALGRADVPPPEPEVVRTPRRDTSLIHRVVILANAAGDEPDGATRRGWSPNAPRAEAEPTLNAIAARLLGDASTVRIGAECFDDSGLLRDTATLTLADLGLCPLDLIYLPPTPRLEAGSELERRITLAFIEQHFADVENPTVRLVTGDDFLPGIDVARRLLLKGRPLDNRDLVPPDDAEDLARFDDRELLARADRLDGLLRETVSELRRAWSEDAPPSTLLRHLIRLCSFGIREGVPPWTAAGSLPGADEVRTAAERAIKVGMERLEASAALGRDDPVDGGARLRAMFGDEFVVLPHFFADDADDLDAALAAHEDLVRGAPGAVDDWLEDMRRVRSGVGRLAASLDAAKVLHDEQGLDPFDRELRVAHLPARPDPDAVWIGLEMLPEQIGLDRTSLVHWVPADSGVEASQPLAGILVDEWTETIPAPKITTGLSFQYDAPELQAPQAILLAVPPDPSQPWTGDALVAALLETRELVRMRAVDPDALLKAGQYLPARYLPDVVEGPDE